MMMYDVKDKEKNIQQMNQYLYAKTLSMFEYTELPDTLSRVRLEKQLQQTGHTFILEHDDVLYALTGHLQGIEDSAYGEPSSIRIDNIPLGIHDEFELDEGVLIYNDDLGLGLEDMFNRYNYFLSENEVTILLDNYNQRIQTLISASDDNTKESAEEFLEQIKHGDLGIIAENPVFEGLRTHNAKTNAQNAVTQLIELNQYLKASLYNELGLNANWNMKRERLTSGEVETNEDVLRPFVDNMLFNREVGIEEMNQRFGTSSTVGFGSVWKLKDEAIITPDDEPYNEPDEEPYNEPDDEPDDEPDNEPDNEPDDEPDVSRETIEDIKEDIEDIEEDIETLQDEWEEEDDDEEDPE